MGNSKVGNNIIIDKKFELDMPIDFLPLQLDVLDKIFKHVAVLYSGAFRAGKTLLLINAAITICLENPKTTGLLGAETETKVYTVLFKLFETMIDKYQEKIDEKGIPLKLTKRLNRTTGSREWEAYNGSIIYFRACGEERNIASYTLDFVGLDEPVDMDESIFTQALGRISGTGNLKNPFVLLTTNPASELHWIYKHFISEDTKQPDYYYVETKTYDNRLLPHYESYIKNMEALSDEDWKRRYLDGKWGMFAGQIYKEFNPNRQVGDYKDYPVSYHICGIDWGLNTPHCILVMGVTESNRLIVKEEYYGTKVTTEELSKFIADKLNKEYKFKAVYVDPSAADLIQQLQDRGINAIGGYNDVNNGIAKCKSIFAGNYVSIDKRCINTIRQLQAYRFKTDTEIPIKKDDHAPDAFRYGVTDYTPSVEDVGFGWGFWNRRR